MKVTYDIDSHMMDNRDRFQNDFFDRFNLRHAPEPLQLNGNISKNYLFPTFYSDVTCAIGIFLCSYKKAQRLVSKTFGPKVKPVKMTRQRSLVAFSCYEYKNVMNVKPYNEIAMTIPVMVDSIVNIPLLPMIMDKMFKKFGYYVFSMPVTSKENQIRGNKLWGLPKLTQDIDIWEENGDCVTVAKKTSGEPYFKLRVPMTGSKTEFDVTSNLYSRLNGELLQSETNFKATFYVKKYMKLLFGKTQVPDRTYLVLGDTPSAQVLKDLEIEAHPFQLRYAKHMNSCFELPNADFKSPIQLPE
ncbi:MAG: acetoacetate decarboxylase family protein [Desulfobacteraceae bacterium]|nr:acetoacetate decarboxylase family protein [Desulfobacteraceae bacterium]